MTNSPWGIDKLNAQAKGVSDNQQQAFEDECRLYALCFSTAEGKKVLARMETLIEGQPTWNPDMKPEYGYYREGQNDVLRHIKNRINFSTNKR